MIPTELQNGTHAEAISVDHGIIGIFGDHEGADKAYDVLVAKGYQKEEVNVLMAKDTHSELINRESPRDSILKEGAIGSAIGGTLGAILGAVATIGTTVLIPGIGIVAGPIAGALVGAGTFAIGGGTYASIMGLDDTEERLDKNILELEKGQILLSVRPKSPEDGASIAAEWTKIPNIVDVYNRN